MYFTFPASVCAAHIGKLVINAIQDDLSTLLIRYQVAACICISRKYIEIFMTGPR